MPATTGEFNGINYTTAAGHISPTAGESTTYLPAIAGPAMQTTIVANIALYSTSATIASAPAGWELWFDAGAAVQGIKWYTYVYPRWPANTSLPQQNFPLSTSAIKTAAIGQFWPGVDEDRPFLVEPSTATAGSGSGTAMTLPAMTPEGDIGLGLWMWCGYRASSATTASVTVPSHLTGAGNTNPAESPNLHMRGAANLDASNLGRNTPRPTLAATGTANATNPWRGYGMILNPTQKPGRMFLG